MMDSIEALRIEVVKQRAEIGRLQAEKAEMADAILQCFPHERRFRALVSFELAEFIFTERRDALAALAEKNS